MSTKNNNNIKGQSLSTPLINHVDQASTNAQSSTQQSSNGAPPPPVIDEEQAESDTDHDASASLCNDSTLAVLNSQELDVNSELPANGPPDELNVVVSPDEENPDEQTSPIRSAFRRPGDRITKRVTIMPAEDGTDASTSVTIAQSTEDTSIRVTEKIKKGTFKESQIIFKAGPPLADTLEKLEKKDESVSTIETPAKEATQNSSMPSGVTALPNTVAAAPPPAEKGKAPTTEEKKKNREDRKKEKEKKKEEEMLFHHEREQEKKTKIVGTDKYDPDTGETGQWLKHAFLLGEGSYKNVYEGYNSKDGCKIAWCEYKAPFQSSDTETITSESAIMKRLHHPHIVKCFDVLTSYYDLEEKRFSRYLVLIQERMEKDSLKLRIQRSFSEGKQHLSMKVLKRWMLQMVEAVNYLHKQVPIIIHRDLKPENIFMMSRGSEDLDDVKIGDFGLASYRDKTTKKTLAGTFGFMAPEMYGENYDEKVDIYALGMVWLEMFTNRPPFDNLRGNFFEIARYTLQGKYPDNLKDVESEAFRELILTLTHPIPHWRCSAELLLHHPVLQTKPIPIVALPQYSQEFVASMHKHHKLPISVRLNDKKLRTAYGFDEGQCLDVDIDLWKEQAIHKTVDELQRDIETTLAERGGDAAKFSVPKKWYDSVRMQLLLFRHILLGQRWRYIYNTLCEKGIEGLPPISTEDGGSQNFSEEFAAQQFPPDVDGNSFITSARHINLMNMTTSYMEREMGETSRPPNRGAVLPISDTVLAIASAECGMMRAEKDQQPSQQQQHHHHQQQQQQQLQHQQQQQHQQLQQQSHHQQQQQLQQQQLILHQQQSLQHVSVSGQGSLLPAMDPAMSLPLQPVPVPVAIPSQSGVPTAVSTWSGATQGMPVSVAGTWSQTIPMAPPGWPQLPPSLWATMTAPGQPAPWPGTPFGALPPGTWTSTPATPQPQPPPGSATPASMYTPAQPGPQVPTMPVTALHHQYPTPQPPQTVPTLTGPVPGTQLTPVCPHQTRSINASIFTYDHIPSEVPPAMLASVSAVPPDSMMGPPMMPSLAPLPSDASPALPVAGPAHATIGSATCAPSLASKLTREVRRVSMPILNGLERVGHNAQRPAQAAWQNGVPKPVAGIYETSKKKRTGVATGQKKRENCKVCLTHTDVDAHGVMRMHIQVHLPDRPASVAGQLMNKCIFAVPITSSLKDIGKQVIEIIQKKQEESPRSSKSVTDFGNEFHELYYGPEMASYIQAEIANIVRLYNDDPKMALPYEVEFTGPQLKSISVSASASAAAAAATTATTPGTSDTVPVRQSSKEESADALRGLQNCPRCASVPQNDTKSFTALVTGATEGDALVTPTSTHFAPDVDRATALTELQTALDGLAVSQLAVVKDVVSNLTKETQEPLVVVPEGRERRVLPVPANCFFVGVPRRPGDSAAGFDVVKGGVGDKFVVSYPREARAPRVWTSTNVFEPVLIMPNDRMYTIDRPAVLHHGPDGPMELLKLPSDGSDKVVSLHGGQASVVDEVSLLLPPRVIHLPSRGAVVVQMAGGGAEPAVLERPCLVIPEPNNVQNAIGTPLMRVVDLPSNPDPEGLDFVLQFLQLLRDPKAMVAAKESGAAAAVAAQESAQQVAAASETTTLEQSDTEGQANNQNSHNKAAPKRKNSREKQRAAGDAGEAAVPSTAVPATAQVPVQTSRPAVAPQTLTQVQVLCQQPLSHPQPPSQPPPQQQHPPQQQPQQQQQQQPQQQQQKPQQQQQQQQQQQPPQQQQPQQQQQVQQQQLQPQQQPPQQQQQQHPLHQQPHPQPHPQPQHSQQQQMSPQFWQSYQQQLLQQQQQYLQQQFVAQAQQPDNRTAQEMQQQYSLHYQQQKLLLQYQMMQQQQHLQHLQQQQHAASQQPQQYYRPPQGPPVVIRTTDSTSHVGQVLGTAMGQPVMLQPWSAAAAAAVAATYPQPQPQFSAGIDAVSRAAAAEAVASLVPSSPRRQAPATYSGVDPSASAVPVPLTPTSNEPPSSTLSEPINAPPGPAANPHSLANGHGPPIPSETIGRFSIVTVAPVETDAPGAAVSVGDD